MDEGSARQVVLAQAIETADTEGRILTPHERGELDRDARAQVIRELEGRRAASADPLIVARARRLVERVGSQRPELAALQHPAGWRRWIEWGLPVVALATGVLTDVIGNPHRLDLISLPLLGFVAWNLAVYLLLAVGALLPHGKRPSWLARLGRFEDGARALRRGSSAEAKAAARFHALWFSASQPLHVARIKRVLHICAAAWALGVILSLLVRGLVVEYRVGWESTFLGPVQVHAILSILRLPALLVFPFEPFSVAEVAQLRFSEGGGARGGAHWVWMYVGILVVLVIVPRLLLAAWSAWREWRLRRSFPLALSGPYFERIASLLHSSVVQLGLLAHRAEDRDAIVGMLARDPRQLPVAVSSDIGDVLRVVDLPLLQPPADPVPAGWMDRLRSLAGGAQAAPDPLLQMRDETDVVVHAGALDDEDAAHALLAWMGRPVLFLRPQDDAIPPPALKAATAVLAQPRLAGTWVQRRPLLEAIGRLAPADKANGFERILRAWEEVHLRLLRASMRVIAEHLLFCVRQGQEVAGHALTVRSILATERQAQSDARQAAMDAIALRLQESARAMFVRLRELHGLGEADGEALVHGLERRFRVEQSVHAPQAGMAGAATGAAMGASVDLLAGGLTLGAAAALGAVVGGGAAYIAAAWKNRTAPAGATLVQLSDAMMQALAQAAIVQYLAIVHSRPGAPATPGAAWQEVTGEALAPHAEALSAQWAAARAQPNGDRMAQPLAHELEQIVLKIMTRLQA